MTQNFQQHLELVFGASVLFMTVEGKNHMMASGFQLGTIYTQVTKPSTVVKLKLTHRKLLSGLEPRTINPMHAFDGVSIHAKVTTVMFEQSLVKTLYPIHSVEFVIFDKDCFLKDLENYVYQHFSEEFTKHLDQVLEEE